MTMFVTAFVIFFILLFAGVPIAFSMGLGSLIGLMVDGTNLSVVAQRLFSGVNSFSLMAIPFFMLSGELMLKGGISRRLGGCHSSHCWFSGPYHSSQPDHDHLLLPD